MSEREAGRHTAHDLAEAAAGQALTPKEAEHLLWEHSAFPIAPARVVYGQIRKAWRALGADRGAE